MLRCTAAGAAGRQLLSALLPAVLPDNNLFLLNTLIGTFPWALKSGSPCPSFPWSFQKYQGKPQKHQGSFSPHEPLKPWKISRKHPKRPRVEKFPRNCRFLSLVVVERVLILGYTRRLGDRDTILTEMVAILTFRK